MYAGAIFIQQSLHLDLYLATAGLLAVTALYTVTGRTEAGPRASPGLPGPLLSPGVRTFIQPLFIPLGETVSLGCGSVDEGCLLRGDSMHPARMGRFQDPFLGTSGAARVFSCPGPSCVTSCLCAGA